MVPLFKQNKTVEEIIILTGASERTVKGYRYKFDALNKEEKISLRARVEALVLKNLSLREVIFELKDDNPVSITPYYYKAKKKLILPIPKKTLCESLELEAEDRGISVKKLTERLLTIIIEHELFSDILDTPR